MAISKKTKKLPLSFILIFLNNKTYVAREFITSKGDKNTFLADKKKIINEIVFILFLI
jgi:hypothetical protein